MFWGLSHIHYNELFSQVDSGLKTVQLAKLRTAIACDTVEHVTTATLGDNDDGSR